jgi:hypothetical protein
VKEKSMIITVTGPPLQYEGIETVLTNVQELANINHIFLEPKCFIETGDRSDPRLPPLDLDGSDRVLERPLSGKKELYGNLVFPFEITESLYAGTPYRPMHHVFETDLIAEAVASARARDMKISMMLSLAKPPGLAEDDYPVMPSGERRLPAISQKGCINNPKVARYGLGLLLDVVKRYQPDGIFVDWLEYTNYHFEDNLLCFCKHCQQKAHQMGFDFEEMRGAALSVLAWVRNASLDDIAPAGNWESTWECMSPGIEQFFEFKARSVQTYVESLVYELNKSGFGQIHLYVAGFAPPMNKGTGMDYSRVSGLSSKISNVTKLYRFHWGLMVGWYANQLAELNRRIPADAWIPFVLDMLELEGDNGFGVEHYRMPRPNEIGPLKMENEDRKLKKALELASSPRRMVPLLHAYCPREVFQKRIAIALASDAETIGIQRYGYTGDKKLKDIGDAIP